jgi:hypothetical protein
MFQYQKYLIKENDRFDPDFFSFVVDDMNMIKEQTEHVLPTFKSEIIVSFLKNHKLESEWSKANPELSKLITSGNLSTANIESLFDSSRHNPAFIQQMETFLKQGFAQ